MKGIFALKFSKVLIMQMSNVSLKTYAILLAMWIHMQLTFFCRPDFETGLQDFKNRLENYEKASIYRVLFMIVLATFFLK